MRIGEFKDRVLIQRYESQEENQEVFRYIWQPYKKIWSKMKAIKSRENEYIFEVRLGIKITPHDSILYQGRFFKVIQINRGTEPYKVLEVKTVETKAKTCKVLSTRIEKDVETNRPIKGLVEVGQYPCEIYRKTLGLSEEKKHLSLRETFVMHTMYDAKIKTGDLIEIDGVKYVAGIPFQPNDYRLEVELTLRGDI